LKFLQTVQVCGRRCVSKVHKFGQSSGGSDASMV
jgi:hypothetical protein